MSSVRLLGALALTTLVSMVTAGCAAETMDEEELAESEDRLLAGRRLTPSQVAAHLRAAGFPENTIGTMVCTAKYESSFYERASNKNRNGSIDRGLFQINSIHLGGTRGCPSKGNADALWNPTTNTQCALAIYKMQGLRAWYGYRKHKTECDRYAAPGSAPISEPANADDAADDASSSEADDGGEGGCWSGTLQDMVDARVCVQSRSSRVWFQCMSGAWYRGGDATTGPFGPCEGSHPL